MPDISEIQHSFDLATKQVWQPAAYAHPEAGPAPGGVSWGQRLAEAMLGTQGVYVYDHRARVMCFVSAGVERLTGLPAAEFTGERHFSLIHPDDLPVVQEATMLFNQFVSARLHAPLPADLTASVDYRLRHADGSYRRVLRHNTILEREPETGALVLVAGILTDITAHKHTLDVRFHLNHPDFPDFVARQPRLRSQALLTAREQQVMDLVLQGLSSRQIAQRLFMSEQTVGTHRRNARAKLHSRQPHPLLLHLDASV
jgi:DNA-binding CsgD family transcriptional regulator